MVELTHPLSSAQRGEVASRLAFIHPSVTQVVISEDGRLASLQVDAAADRALIEKAIQHVADSIATTLDAGPASGTIEVFRHHDEVYREDPTPALLLQHELVEELQGVYSLGPGLSGLLDHFDQAITDIAGQLGARSYRFPALISVATLEELNYFRAFPHTLTFASHLRRDLAVLEDFADHAHCSCGELQMTDNSLAAPTALLSPAVCYHLYIYFRKRVLPAEGVTATAAGHCFRHEASNLKSLERLWDFTMREIMFIGSPEHIQRGHSKARELVHAWLASLRLNYQVEDAHDPFFTGQFKRQTTFQQAFALKQELRASLPHAQHSLAVASFNYHQDFFGRKLDISTADGTPAHTGCVAFGLERLVYAFLAQHGCSPENWPPQTRQGH